MYNLLIDMNEYPRICIFSGKMAIDLPILCVISFFLEQLDEVVHLKMY